MKKLLDENHRLDLEYIRPFKCSSTISLALLTASALNTPTSTLVEVVALFYDVATPTAYVHTCSLVSVIPVEMWRVISACTQPATSLGHPSVKRCTKR